MEHQEVDAIVVGGGPAGYVCAIRLGQLGQRVACVEADEYGGVCLNWGCVPSKVLISNAHLYRTARSAAERGVDCGPVQVDPERMQEHKNGIVSKLTAGVRALLRSNSVQSVRGRGRLVDARTVEVSAADGSRRRLVAKKAVVIATGSETIEVAGFEFDGERIIGAQQAVSLTQIPRRLLVIGGGAIGLELGMVYQNFGSQLTVVELLPSLLAGLDPDCVKVVERSLKKHGASVLTNARAQGYETHADGVIVRVLTDGVAQPIECDTVLVAVGMKPRSRGIGLEEVEVALDHRGFVAVNHLCQTNVAGVYAIGDVSGPPLLAHKASKEGEVCAEVIAGQHAAKDWISIPSVVFTDPEIAAVGLTEQQASSEGLSVKVGRFPFAALGRALSIGETEGFVKVVTDVTSQRIVGIHIVGPGASDLISEASLALEMVATAEDVAHTIHPHPTLGEAVMEASAASLGRAIHVVNR